MNTVKKGQDWFLEKMIALGYNMSKIGQCHGIATMAMQSFLAQEKNKFIDRILDIGALSIEDIEKIKRSPLNIQITLSNKKNIKPYDLLAFFDGVRLYQEPFNYSTLFSEDTNNKQDSFPAQMIVSPIYFEKHPKERPVDIATQLHAFNHKQLTSYLNLLQNHINVPFSMVIGSIDHAINLSYDPKSKEWTLIDAEKLPFKKFNDCEKLASELIDSLNLSILSKENSENNAVFFSHTFVNNQNQKTFLNQFDAITKTKEWNEISEITKDKLKIMNHNNTNLFLIAAFNGDINTLEEIIKKGENVNLQDKDGTTSLMLAAQNGSTKAVNLLIEAGADVNQVSSDQKSAAHLAAAAGHTDIIKLLFKKDANLNLYTNSGMSPLSIAAQRGHLEIVEFISSNVNISDDELLNAFFNAAENGHEKIVRYLLSKKKFSINAIDPDDYYEVSALHQVCKNGHQNVVALLLESEAKVNLKDGEGRTALMYAAEKGDIKIVNALLDAGAKLHKVDNHGETALSLAVKAGHLPIVKALIKKGINIKQEEDSGLSYLKKAIVRRHADVAKELITIVFDNDKVDKKNSLQALMTEAVKYGDLKEVSVLLDEGAEISRDNIFECVQRGKENILNEFAKNKQALKDIKRDKYKLLSIAIEKNYPEIIRTLIIHAQADIDYLPENEWESFICKAAVKGHSEVVKLLIDFKADVNKTTNNPYQKRFPLNSAAERGFTIIAQDLINAGAKINEFDGYDTPLSCAIKGGHIDVVKLLIKSGADLASPRRQPPLLLAIGSNNIEMLKVILSTKPSYLKKLIAEDLYMAIHFALKNNKLDSLKLIIASGVDINMENNKGDTPLILAVKKGDKKAVDFLLANCANVNRQNFNGDTALHLSIKNEEEGIFKALVNAGADLSIGNKKGYTPLQIAIKKGHIDIIIEILLNHKDVGHLLAHKNPEGKNSFDMLQEKGIEVLNKLVNNCQLNQLTTIIKKGYFSSELLANKKILKALIERKDFGQLKAILARRIVTKKIWENMDNEGKQTIKQAFAGCQELEDLKCLDSFKKFKNNYLELAELKQERPQIPPIKR